MSEIRIRTQERMSEIFFMLYSIPSEPDVVCTLWCLIEEGLEKSPKPNLAGGWKIALNLINGGY